jgi:hypothetical protein
MEKFVVPLLFLVACSSEKPAPSHGDDGFALDVVFLQDEAMDVAMTDMQDTFEWVEVSSDLPDVAEDFPSQQDGGFDFVSEDEGLASNDVRESIIADEIAGEEITCDDSIVEDPYAETAETANDSNLQDEAVEDIAPSHFCGDGHCDEWEDCTNCEADCGVCPSVCGDEKCEGAEDCATCPQDCGICSCGDGWCSDSENCALCPSDCGFCPPPCSDGTCATGETCWLCPQDCGVCPIDCSDCIPRLYFGASYEEKLSKAIVAGRQLSVFYEVDRLSQCRGQSAIIELFYVFPPSTEQQSVVVASFSEQTGRFEATERTISIPSGATQVVFWAKNSDMTGCVGWDSDFGKNYTFPVFSTSQIASPITWADNFQFVWITEGGVVYKGDVDPAYFFESMLGSELVTGVQVQVYMPGVTDIDYPPEVLEQVSNTAIRAVIVTDAYPLSYGEKKAFPLKYVGRGGLENHDFIYRFTPTRFEWFLLPDGAYNYHIEVSMAENAEKIVFKNPSDNSKDRVFVVAHHPRCDLFPYNPPPEYCGN